MTDPKKPVPPKQPPEQAEPATSQASQGKPVPSMQNLEQQVARLTDIAARAQADLQNFKARMERDALELRAFIQSGLLLKIFPVLDDLSRAIAHPPSKDGLEQIFRKLEKVLSDTGVKKIEAIGKHVDPLCHEIVNSGPGEKERITIVHEEGYELGGRILRPAKVQVGDGTTVK